MNEARRRVLVVGAGIGGLAAALALRRAGYSVDVAERTGELCEVGAGIQLSPNAGRVLADLGLEAALAAVAIEPAALEIRSGLNGRLLSALPRDTLRQRYGVAYRVLHRSDLQSVLLSAARADPDIRLHLATEVTSFREDDDRVTAEFRSPSDLGAVSFAALIAADGVRSSVRTKVAPQRTAQPAGRTAWRALVPTASVAGAMRGDAVVAWLGPRAHLVCYPVSRGAAVNLVAIVEDGSAAAGWGTPGDAAELAAHFRSWSPEVRRLISAVASWGKFDLMSVDARGPWVQGRAALLGDAAHAMLPFLAQGAAMAIEDASVLAATLKGATDIPAALKSYEARRRQRVVDVAAAAARTGVRYHYAGPIAAARDLGLRVAGARLVLRQLDWVYRWQPSAG